MTDHYAVVGNPVAHSLSPRIHAAFARQTGQDLCYDTLLAPLDGFAATVETFFAQGGAGLNVTVPFKEQAAAWVTELEAQAAAAGAVNTIVRDGAGFSGHNTDGPGLVTDLTVVCGQPLADTAVLLVGAGGAARGVVRPLLDAGPRRLVIANRTAGKASDLARALLAERPGADIRGCGLADTGSEFDVVINATSAGLTGSPAASIPDAAVAGAFCYDMIYSLDGEAATAFCRWATARGAGRVADGLGMLLEQAAEAFFLWRGVKPDTAPVRELLRPGSV